MDREDYLHHDHDVAQLTRLRSEPHKLLSRRLPGKSTLPVSPVAMLARREANFSGRSRFTSADSCHVLSQYLPHNGPLVIDKINSVGQVSQFSDDGSLLVAGFMGGPIRIYNVDRGWNVRNHIHAKDSILSDMSLSPDKRFLVYADISPNLHIVNLESSSMESDANITEIHESLDFSAANDTEHGGIGSIYTVKFSADGRELVCGSRDASIYVYDLGENRLSLHVRSDGCSVVAACFADESGHVIYSGDADGLCKVWDRRCFFINEQPSGVLEGHLEAVTFIDSRGDGRHLISNARDQTIKLWDIRKLSSNLTLKSTILPWCHRPVYSGSQRYFLMNPRHPDDISLATYRGHQVFGPSIRCYFSPEESTGQKYIYTGSADGSVYIYDLLTGEQVAKLDHHEGVVRDCSWHPYFPSLINTSGEGVIAKWEF